MATKSRGPKEAEAKYECDHRLLTSYNKLNGLLPNLSVCTCEIGFSNFYFFPSWNLFDIRVAEGIKNIFSISAKYRTSGLFAQKGALLCQR